MECESTVFIVVSNVLALQNSSKQMITVLSQENTRLRMQVYVMLPDIVL